MLCESVLVLFRSVATLLDGNEYVNCLFRLIADGKMLTVARFTYVVVMLFRTDIELLIHALITSAAVGGAN